MSDGTSMVSWRYMDGQVHLRFDYGEKGAIVQHLAAEVWDEMTADIAEQRKLEDAFATGIAGALGIVEE